jgi:mono/diheme cytochrome c family protein
MNKPAKIILALLVVLLLFVCGGYGWAAVTAAGARSRLIETHRIDFPIPFPLTEEERAELAPGEDPAAAALARAIERGRHLVESRYVCGDCHGTNFAGGVMIDDPMIGRALGPNLTGGRGSRIDRFTPADWDRAVRHGVSLEGRPMVMPAVDSQLMSDQELSDIIAFLRTQPAVDNEVAPVRFGPLGTVLVATKALPFSVDAIPSHAAPHAAFPPATEVSVEFGRHIAGVCTGCHGATFVGGPIPGAPPAWAPARNLTPHADALGNWTYEDFVAALRDGIRPDGTALREPMTFIIPYTRNQLEVEVEALWMYLRSLPPVAPTS